MKQPKFYKAVGGKLYHYGDLSDPCRITYSIDLGVNGFAEVLLHLPEKQYAYWPGGENPAPGKLVDIIFRDGNKIGGGDANLLRWAHVQKNGDVIAWRLSADQGEGNASDQP